MIWGPVHIFIPTLLRSKGGIWIKTGGVGNACEALQSSKAPLYTKQGGEAEIYPSCALPYPEPWHSSGGVVKEPAMGRDAPFLNEVGCPPSPPPPFPYFLFLPFGERQKGERRGGGEGVGAPFSRIGAGGPSKEAAAPWPYSIIHVVSVGL